MTGYDPATRAMIDQLQAAAEEIGRRYELKPIDAEGIASYHQLVSDALIRREPTVPSFTIDDEKLSVDPEGRWSAVSRWTDDGTIALDLTVRKDMLPREEKP